MQFSPAVAQPLFPDVQTMDYDQQLKPMPCNIDESRKDLYLHHEAVVHALAGKDIQFETASSRAESSREDAKVALAIALEIRQNEKDLIAQLAVLEKRKLRRRIFPNKSNERITKIQQTLAAVAEEARGAKKKAKEARRKAKADISAMENLRPDAELLRNSERARRDILEAVYGGSDLGSPQENSIETARDRLVQITNRAKDSLSAQQEALQLLKSAADQLREARSLLYDAQFTNTVDLFSGGGLGLVAGLGSQYRFNTAAKIIHEARLKVEKALVLNEQLPISKTAKIKNGGILGIADIVLDGIVTDLLVRVTIEKAVKSVEAILEQVLESISFQSDHVDQLEGNVRGFSHDLDRTSEDLVRVRTTLMRSSLSCSSIS